MPKRATLTYTSEDAPKTTEAQLYVYYCKYSGIHAFTTDCDLNKLPRRRTDNSRILDMEKHAIRLQTSDGGEKLIKRFDGRIERQLRLNIGKLPIAYHNEEGGRYLYILDNAVTTYVSQGRRQAAPVPPCIYRVEPNSSEMRVDIEDKQATAAIIKISADAVKLHLTSNISHEAAQQELLQFMAKVLSTRLTQLTLSRGASNRNKLLLIDKLTPQQVYEKLQAHMHKTAAAAEARSTI